MKIVSRGLAQKIFAILLSLGSIFGFIIDRVSGRSLENIQFFKQGLTPDGVHYSLKTLRFLSLTDFDALNEIRNQYVGMGINISPYFLNPDPWERALVDPRILYSVLSAPFVASFGLNGMFIVPILSFLILTLIPVLYQVKSFTHDGILLPLFLSIILLSSFYIKFNVLANTTDGLSTLLIVLIALIIYRHFTFKKTRYANVVIALLTLAACTTRQNEIYLVGIFLLVLIPTAVEANIREKITLITPSLITMFVWLMFSFSKFENYKIITASNGVSITDGNIALRIIDLSLSLPKTTVIEFFQLWLRDPGVFLLMVIASLIAIVYKKRSYIVFCFGWSLFSGMTLTTLNAGLGSGFRYALPSIFLASIVLLEFNKHAIKNSDATT